MNALTSPSPASHELRFFSLFDPGRGFSFPCKADGRIAHEQMTPNVRASYLRARSMVGCELSAPVVVCRPTDDH
jgi:hypothetical protein